MKKLAVYLLYLLAGLGLLFLLFFQPSPTPLNYRQAAYYQSTADQIDRLVARAPVADGDTLYAGWAKQNITPHQPTKLMGYGWKGDFRAVRDSLWVRSVVFRAGQLAVALVSYDLMLTPPAVARAVRQRLKDRGIANVYFTAIHTHHGFGEWQTGPAGTFITGGYDAALVERLVTQTVACVQTASRRTQPTTVHYARYDRAALVSNRLVRDGPEDPYLRLVYLQQASGATAVISSFSAHATFLPSRARALSADYPGAVVHLLEERSDVEFALFAAGAVGSHAPAKEAEKNLTTYAHRLLALPDTLVNESDTVVPYPMRLVEIPIVLDEPQLRLFAGWQVRPWLFRWFFGETHPMLTVFRLGDIVFIGLPADFSGMLYPAIQSDLEVIVTSFNGEYIGYVIPDAHYDLPHREARETNWYGPQTGSYTVALINRVLEVME